MSYTDFQIGEKFPLPIRQQGEGGLFQVDANGAMFILQLAKSDIIAIEAFRTGEMELALYETEGVLFLLYRIPGIFKDGWGDAPLSLSLVKEDLLPDEDSLADPTIHLYLVDTKLKILLAQRTASIPEDFAEIIRKNIRVQKEAPLSALAFQKKVAAIWAEKSAADLRAMASATHVLPMALGNTVH